MIKARRVTRGLHVHPEVDDIHQHLHMPLRLHCAAHQAEAHKRFTILHDKRGDDGVKRSLARGIDIGMALIQRKKLAPVLQHKTEAVGHKPRTHAAVVRLNQRHHHAVSISDRQIGRIALPLQHGFARPKFRGRTLGVNQRKPLLAVGL